MSPRAKARRGPLRLVVSAHKGGVGKTTLAVNLAGAFAEDGRRTLLVDVDPQGSATAGLSAEGSRPNVYDVLMARTPVAEAVVKTEQDRLDLLAADLDLAAAEIELPRLPGWQSRLRDTLGPLIDSYDVVVLDSAPGLGVLPFATLVAGDAVLIAATPAFLTLRALDHVIDTTTQAQAFNPDLRVLGIVPSIVGPRTRHRDEALGVLERRWPGWSLPQLERRVALMDAAAAGQPITTFAPRSPSAAAVRALAQEVIARAEK